MLEETSDDVSEMAKYFYKDFYWSEKIFCSLPIVKFKLFLPGRTHFLPALTEREEEEDQS